MTEMSWERRAEAAEKTVRVLKHEVRKLHDGGAQSPIHRALEKARQREEQNRQRRELAEVRAANLEDQVAERTRAIRTILDHVTFGFLVVGPDGRVREGFTRSCEALFAREPEVGGALTELLRCDARQSAEMALGLDQIFEDFMPEEVTVDQLPKRFEIEARVLRLEARAVRAEDETVDGVLFTVSDITALEAAERESRHREVLIGILQQKTAFEQFVMDTRTSLEMALEAVDDQVTVRRVVHTVKGNAASWGLDDVVSVTHEVEMDAEIGGDGIAAVHAAMRAFLKDNVAVLGFDYDDVEPAFEITAENLKRLRTLAADPANMNEVSGWIRQVVQRPAHELIGPMNSFVEKLGQRLEKEVEFELSGEDVQVDSEVMRPVLRNLSHLVRNSVDHGLEPSWERGEKPARGRVSVHIIDAGRAWEIRVEDDGRGIPVDRLTAKAVKLGRVDAETVAKMDRQQKIALIFEDGVSSADVATDISGRGVGMSAVRAAVRASGGFIDVQTSPRGTCFVLSVPKPSERVAA
ncbi:MAG: ATP-binding protein [Sandaracinaceae bacterium]